MWVMQSQFVFKRSLEGGWTDRCSRDRAGRCCMNIITRMTVLMIMMTRNHDDLGTCATSLVSPEQPALCIPVQKQNLAINPGIKH